jgi:hypothetical protein
MGMSQVLGIALQGCEAVVIAKGHFLTRKLM